MASQIRFAGYPSAFVFEAPDGKKKVQHLLWGDWLRLKPGDQGDFREVRARGVDGWMRKDAFTTERLLEATFVDVGQGDGCLVVTPDDEKIVIDAGVDDHMYRFLRWRFGEFRDPIEFDVAIISHPDQDHYAGFSDLLLDPMVSFGALYHNGIMERKGSDALGPRKKDAGRSYLTDLVGDEAELRDFLSVPSRWKGKRYPTMLEKALAESAFGAFRALSVADGHLPGFGPGAKVRFEILGPVTEPDAAGRPRLRWLGGVGKTKNGHSVVLRAVYGDVALFLGGDLNVESQKLLLGFHSGLDPIPGSLSEHDVLIETARQRLEVDVTKSCHHGSADFYSPFLEALNPAATVISSGDDESHAHPRADALGTIGKRSCGFRPLIFSTELARSWRDQIRHPSVLRARLHELLADRDLITGDTAQAKKLRARIDKKLTDTFNALDRSVAVFGTIQLRTDGKKVAIAQKLERPRGKTKWDIYALEPDAAERLLFESQHE
jgi:beta-lactamase superfamily II metal-dependent hydrolase